MSSHTRAAAPELYAMIFDLISCSVALAISFKSTTVIIEEIFTNTGATVNTTSTDPVYKVEADLAATCAPVEVIPLMSI
jgi:hypothetical protein